MTVFVETFFFQHILLRKILQRKYSTTNCFLKILVSESLINLHTKKVFTKFSHICSRLKNFSQFCDIKKKSTYIFKILRFMAYLERGSAGDDDDDDEDDEAYISITAL